MAIKAYKNRKNLPAFLLLILAAALGIISVYYHEMWRDESQAFLIVRDSKNLAELWQNVRYEGHPILWYLILYLSYHIFPSIYTIQIIHLLIGLSIVWLILLYSPFTLFEKFLLIFSYFFSFEYLVVSRNYSIGILLLFAAVIFFFRNKSAFSIIVLAFLLGLSANANIYSLVIAFWLFLFFLVQTFLDKNERAIKKKEVYLSVIIFVLLNVVAVLQLVSPPDRTPKVRIAYVVTLKKLDKVFGEIAESMYYLADPNQNEKYWGTNFFKKNFGDQFFNNVFHHIPTILAFSIIIVFLITCRKKGPAIFYMVTFTTLFVFTLMVFDKGFLRHTGAFFILFIIAYWIYRETTIENTKLNKTLEWLFTLMLVFQTISAAIVHAGDIKYPFSNAKEAAAFLKETKRDTNVLIHPDFYGMSLLHYAHLKKVYYPISESWGSFIRFNTARKPKKFSDIYKIANREQVQTMIFNSPLTDSVLNQFGFDLIYAPPNPSTVTGEDFYIYGRRNK